MDYPKPACSLLSLQCTAIPKSPWCTWENLWMARCRVTCATIKTSGPPASAGPFFCQQTGDPVCCTISKGFGGQVVWFPPGRITLFTHTKRTVGISTTARHEESVLDWINYREKECVGTVINMFLYQRGSVHFYSLAAGLFYLQDWGNII